jgi:hypothetical protein
MNPLRWRREHLVAWALFCMVGAMIGLLVAWFTSPFYTLCSHTLSSRCVLFMWLPFVELYWPMVLFGVLIPGLTFYAVRLLVQPAASSSPSSFQEIDAALRSEASHVARTTKNHRANLSAGHDLQNKAREPPGHRFLVVSICIYFLSIILCLAANAEASRQPLFALLLIPIVFPLVFVLLIPAMFFVWAQMGTPFIPIGSIKQVMARNGRFIAGGILLTSVIVAAAAGASR